MKISLQLKIAFFSAFCLSAILSPGQSIPVGTPVLEDYYRRAQLLGQLDSSISFTARPFFPVEALKLKNAFDPTQTFDQERKTKFDGIYHFGGKKGLIQLLPFSWQQQFNTNHPYSLNDGAMIPARGYQTIVSGGFYAKAGPISIQLRPEMVYAENKTFKVFSKTQIGANSQANIFFQNIIDLPERFGKYQYHRLLWGQSSIRITSGSFSVGISNENLWWGPGMQNALLMTNNANGFKHFTINTVVPVRTILGTFEGQIIGGRLNNSGISPPDKYPVYYQSYILFQISEPKIQDYRYINGIVLSFNPKWVPGLFLGLTRSFIVYRQDMGNSFSDYFPVLSPFQKKNTGTAEDSKARDQRVSVFVRWLLQKDHAELYFEFGKEDHAYNLRDFLIQPDHARAYILGFRKLFPLNSISNRCIQLNVELSQFETNKTNYSRAGFPWYAHLQVRDGYTNEGQMLGSGIGLGSNLQSISISWVNNLKSIGLQIERLSHDNDLFYYDIKDIRSNWVDIDIEALGEWNYRNLLFSAKLELIRSLNYQFNYQPITTGIDQFWVPGRDTYNFQANIGISYRF